MNATLLLMSASLLPEIAVYVVGSCVLMWVAAKMRATNTGTIFAFLLCCAAAYSTAFTLEVCFLQVTGVMSVQLGLLIKWGLFGIAGFVIAEAAEPSGWLAMIPCCVIGLVMMMQGPVTADPLINFPFGSRGFNQYSLLMGNVSFAAGMAMIFLSVPAALAVGARRKPRETSPTLIAL